ncbi:hypothetical protein [Blastococcus sp. SYSU D01042]
MTDAALTAGQTRITARVIPDDPVAPKRERSGRPLSTHPGGAVLLWAAGIVSGLGVLPLVLERFEFELARSATSVARTIAPAWPAGGDPLLWPTGVATAAWLLAVAVVGLAVAGVKLPDAVVLVLGVVLAGCASFVVWSTIDVVNDMSWWLVPACLLGVLAFLASARAATRWRATGSGRSRGGAVGRTLQAWAGVAVVLVAGTAIVTQIEEQAAASAGGARSATLAELHDSSLAGVRELQGWWVPQIASAKITDPAADGLYAARHQELADDYPVVLARGGDFPSASLGSEDWMTLVRQPFWTETDAQGWCDENGLGPGDCLPRYLSAG